MSEFSVIGTRQPKTDGIDLVTGRGIFLDDVRLPNMLIGKVLRSRYAHAKILNIDTSAAERLPGVKAVVTAKDTPHLRFGVPYIYDEVRDQPIFAEDKAIGYMDPIAGVVAVNEEVALDALRLIKVDYEELPAVFDPEEAMKEGAPLVHPNIPGNLAAHKKVYAGDVERGFAESDIIVEGVYETQNQEHANMEPHGAIAQFDRVTGFVNVWTTTQTVFSTRRDLVKLFPIPLQKFNVIQTKCGGGYGGKNQACVEPIVVIMSYKAGGAPVKYVFSREEEFMASTWRHREKIYSKTGVKKDGTLWAKEVKIIMDNGCYSDHGPGVAFYAGGVFGSLYRVQNIKYDCYVVYTNNTYGGAFRGYGNAQMTFALEGDMDKLARELNMDPLAFRLKNAPARGETSVNGYQLKSCGLQECLREAAITVDWQNKWKGWE